MGRVTRHLMGPGYRPRCGAVGEPCAQEQQDVDCWACWAVAGHHGPHDRPWRGLVKRAKAEGLPVAACGHATPERALWDPTGEVVCSFCHAWRAHAAAGFPLASDELADEERSR